MSHEIKGPRGCLPGDLQSEHNALQRHAEALEQKLALAVEGLKRECCCTGETNWATGKPVTCDACDTLAGIDQK